MWYTKEDALKHARPAAYIVELEPGVWACDVEQSDPGRVCEIANAQRFATRMEADEALTEARKFRPFARAVVRVA